MKQVTPEVAEKYRKVVELRMAGLTFDAIAKETGYIDRTGAKRAYDSALNRWAVESVEQQRIIQSERLDRLFFEAFGQAVRGGDLAAIDRCLKIEKRRAELWGLDAPKQHEIAGPEGGPLLMRTDIGELLLRKLAQLQTDHVDTAEVLGVGDG